MSESALIAGLESFALTQSDLRSLGSARVDITARLDSFRLTPAVTKRSPSERLEYLDSRANRWMRSLRKKWPTDSFSVVPCSNVPTEIKSTVRARDVRNIAQFHEIAIIVVERVEGKRKRRNAKTENKFYCVRAKVAIQIEGVTRGNQTWEDRFVLVHATSFDDAIDKLKNEWKEYEKPYLNSDGQMVRWKFEKIVDVYSTGETEIDPRGTEVYSELLQRRMKREYEWRT